MSLGERIKQIRKEWNLTQQALGNRIGVKQNTIALIESGKRNTSDQLLISICREFDVNEHWLRTGEGEMLVELSQNEALANQIRDFLQGDNDGFRERLVSLLIRLKPEQWDILEQYARELFAYQTQSKNIKPIQTPAPDYEAEARAEAEAYYQEILQEKKAAAESSVSTVQNNGSKLA